jgi:hypothetical protein
VIVKSFQKNKLSVPGGSVGINFNLTSNQIGDRYQFTFIHSRVKKQANHVKEQLLIKLKSATSHSIRPISGDCNEKFREAGLGGGIEGGSIETTSSEGVGIGQLMVIRRSSHEKHS